jgi:leucyl-tRNA synthetase
MQRHWIGKSTGADIDFQIKGHNATVRVFTTRADTLFGATFMVLAPDHPLVDKIATVEHRAKISAYQAECQTKTDMERTNADREKTGVFTGALAINPANGAEIPIYIADYVLATYGHGAIMAVPAHDERDHAFAKKYGIAIKQVLDGAAKPIDEAAHVGDGTLIESGFLNGLQKDAAQKQMIDWLVSKKIGEARTTYKLRDWLFSRQRYWGEPFPVAHDADGKVHLLSEADLPILLPDLQEYRPTGTGESPLAHAKDWLTYQDPKTKQNLRRETNTMPQWAGSCWYYLRFIDPTNEHEPWNAAKERYWMPVDLYVGGAEHAVLHLLYARFWHKVLFDLGYVSTKEPFQRLVNQGMILGENGEKMSKSRGNSVNPDDIVRDYGSDTFRLYEMFMGPLEATKPWKTEGLLGCQRFLSRIWRLVHERVLPTTSVTPTITSETERLIHRTIQKVTEDTEGMRFNTAISAMMELVNGLYKTEGPIPSSVAKTLAQLLGPYAPHMAEELWELLGGTESIAYVDWPKFDPNLTKDESQTLSIQVNGKLRGTVTVPIGTPEAAAVEAALAVPGIDKHFEGKPIRRKIYVAGKIINFVV